MVCYYIMNKKGKVVNIGICKESEWTLLKFNKEVQEGLFACICTEKRYNKYKSKL